MTLRRLRRALALTLALSICFLRYWIARLGGPLQFERQALWLQASCRGVIAALNIDCLAEGQPPSRGLVVANHLSYLDIVILSGIMPCFFVAKAEVDRWPFFGWAARAGGTLFLDRTSLAGANRVAAQMSERLEHPIPALLFPEGTSTDGSEVLRFHSRLIQPATRMGAPIAAAAIRYKIMNGPAPETPEEKPERELCWYGDAGFLTHLWNVLGMPSCEAVVQFGEPRIYANPRAAAQQTRAEIIAMRSACN
jgi:lyso-ornithine lipid O-acyltransferase